MLHARWRRGRYGANNVLKTAVGDLRTWVPLLPRDLYPAMISRAEGRDGAEPEVSKTNDVVMRWSMRRRDD